MLREELSTHLTVLNTQLKDDSCHEWCYTGQSLLQKYGGDELQVDEIFVKLYNRRSDWTLTPERRAGFLTK